MADIGNNRTDIGSWESRPAVPDNKMTTTTTTTATATLTTGLRETNYSSNIFTMNELVNETYFNLKDYLTVQKKIPTEALKECKGIMFLSLMKGGVGVGIMIAHDIMKNEWNGPCAVSVSYISTGVDFNMEKINYCLLINNENMISLLSKGYLQIGSDILLTTNFSNVEEINKVPKNNNTYVRLHEQKKSLIFLLTNEASNMNLSLDGAIITINKQCNDQYYQRQVEVFDVLNGNAKPVSEDAKYWELVELLNQYFGASTTKTSRLTSAATTAANRLTDTTSHAMATASTTATNAAAAVASAASSLTKTITNNIGGSGNKQMETTTTSSSTHEVSSMKPRERWFWNENIPLYQFYANNRSNNVSYQQLSSLPSFPFLHDVQNKKFKLRTRNQWPLGKIYQQFKTYWPFNKKTNVASSSVWRVDENVPLFQYYMNNKLLNYDRKQLVALPKYPFVEQVQNHKTFITLQRYNPMNIGKQMYSRLNTFLPHQQQQPSSSTHGHNFDAKFAEIEKQNLNEQRTFIPLYQYYNVHNENSDQLLKTVQYNRALLSKLPVLPFLNDVKSNRYSLRRYNPINAMRSYYKQWTRAKPQTKKANTWNQSKWVVDENIPLFQYYVLNNKNVSYDSKQLSALPKFPFTNDVRNKQYSLFNYNPINTIKSYYQSYIKTNRRANTIYNYYYNYGTNKKWHFNENAPLFQYYVVHNENSNQLVESIQYNKSFLSKLPTLPFSKDIKIRKYSLFKYNPLNFSKKMYNQVASRWANITKKKVVKSNNHENETKFEFDETIPLYQYYMTTNNNNNSVPNAENRFFYDHKTLSHLPIIPYLNDIKTSKFTLLKQSAAHNISKYYSKAKKTYVDTKLKYNNYNEKLEQERAYNKQMEKARNHFTFSELIPLYQFYSKNERLNEMNYNYIILASLPKYPFLNDIRNNKFYLKKYNPINVTRKIYTQIMKKTTTMLNDKKQPRPNAWSLENENIPLVQFYLRNVNVNYDSKQLSALPKYPFLNDIKLRKYKLTAFSLVNSGKQFIKQMKNTYTQKSTTHNVNVNNNNNNNNNNVNMNNRVNNFDVDARINNRVNNFDVNTNRVNNFDANINRLNNPEVNTVRVNDIDVNVSRPNNNFDVNTNRVGNTVPIDRNAGVHTVNVNVITNPVPVRTDNRANVNTTVNPNAKSNVYDDAF